MTIPATDFLNFLLGFALLLLGARGLGEVARRLGQPSVIGELLAGVVLGPTLIGALAPAILALFPRTGAGTMLLQLIAQLGVVLLLLLSGMETNLEVIRRGARSAVVIAATGMFVPFIAGLGLAAVLPGDLIGPVASPSIFALFLATALSMSAIPVIVKILIDLDLMRRDVGQLILAAGMLTDSVGWLLLALVAGAASAQGTSLTSVGVSLAGILLLAILAFSVGTDALRWLLARVDQYLGGQDTFLSVVLALGLIGAAITQALHLEAFLGAFLVGVMLSRIPRVRRRARAPLEAMTLGVFAPIFFATAGLRVELGQILVPRVAFEALAVIAVACLSKFVGAYLGARLAGLTSWLALALGAGLNARGAVEIIVATVGLDLGILTPSAYSIIVLMAIVTSLLAPPSLRWALRRLPLAEAEERRLRQEAFQARSFLHGVSRVLVPVRDGRYALQAARVVASLAGSREIDVVILHVVEDKTTARSSDDGLLALDREVIRLLKEPLGERVHLQLRTIEARDDIVPTILAEAGRGYDLLVLGAAGRTSSRGLFGRTTDQLIAASPCPVFVLRLPLTSTLEIRRVILPTAGTIDDQLAAEFAVALARGTGAPVVALHVAEVDPLAEPFPRSDSLPDSVTRETVGKHATRTVEALGEILGVPVQSLVRWHAGDGAERQIVAESRGQAGDLILLAARRRLAGADLYCGRTIEYVLQQAQCPVAVLFPMPAHGQDLV